MKTAAFCIVALVLGYFLATYFGTQPKRKDSVGIVFGEPEAFTISDVGGRTVTVADDTKIAELKTYFSELVKKDDIVKVLFKYKLHLYSSGKAASYRVTEDGMILNDVPASEIQDGYTPVKPGLSNFLESLFQSSN